MNQPSSKVHTSIGHACSLCGLAPKNGQYNIVPLKAFFAAPVADQCGKCIAAFERRGYLISSLRDRARASLADSLVRQGYSLDGLDADNPYTRWEAA